MVPTVSEFDALTDSTVSDALSGAGAVTETPPGTGRTVILREPLKALKSVATP
jgi:Cdc6-like AAA superfamily ATPase